MMGRYADVTRSLKRQLDLLFPLHRGSVRTGGNIVHQRATTHGQSMLWHSVLNYSDEFPVSAWLGFYDERIGLELAIALGSARPEWLDFVKTERDRQAGFMISGAGFSPPPDLQGCNAGDPDWAARWAQDVAEWAHETEPDMLERLVTLENIAIELRGRLLETENDGLDFYGWKRWELMLIAAKASGADWFDEAYFKLIGFCESRKADSGLFEAIKAHLDATPSQELCSTEHGRRRLSALLN